jgi:uncharacterized protein YoxC
MTLSEILIAIIGAFGSILLTIIAWNLNKMDKSIETVGNTLVKIDKELSVLSTNHIHLKDKVDSHEERLKAAKI